MVVDLVVPVVVVCADPAIGDCIVPVVVGWVEPVVVD